MFSHVLCAVDRLDTAGRLVRHAAGLAASAGGRLSLVHVTGEPPGAGADEDWQQLFLDAVPYSAGYIEQPSVHLVQGAFPDSVLTLADETRADLIICGTRARGAVAGWLLGSASQALLQATTRPVLLVPANDVDIVTIGDTRVDLNLGAVLTPLDLAEQNDAQLHLAGGMAAMAQRPLIVMTVLPADEGVTDHAAAEALRARARAVTPVRPHAMIVRRGEVADQIGRCALQENAGLVVMGLRDGTRGQRPGSIASELLHAHRKAVLAVPNARVTVI